MEVVNLVSAMEGNLDFMLNFDLPLVGPVLSTHTFPFSNTRRRDVRVAACRAVRKDTQQHHVRNLRSWFSSLVQIRHTEDASTAEFILSLE